jgi:hypothetical protein
MAKWNRRSAKQIPIRQLADSVDVKIFSWVFHFKINESVSKIKQGFSSNFYLFKCFLINYKQH